jgi:hypothetical protein
LGLPDRKSVGKGSGEPNVRASAGTTVGRQARAGENVPRTARLGLVACRILVRGADAGLEQVRAGLAWFFKRYAKELPPDRGQQYADMEVEAISERRGLWAEASPLSPWEWRLTRGRLQVRAPPDPGARPDSPKAWPWRPSVERREPWSTLGSRLLHPRPVGYQICRVEVRQPRRS